MNIVSFSGGKDSTAMLLYMLENNIPVDKVVFFDTMLEFPQMYDHINKVKKYTGIDIEFIIPDRHFFYLMTEHPLNNRTFGGIRNGYGWPTMLRRWCTAEKNAHLKRWKKPQPDDAVFFVGIASDENRPLDPNKKYPLIEAGITGEAALQMCYDAGFDFGGLYKHFRRVSCWCCPLGGKRRAKILWEYYPELWDKLKLIQTVLFHDWGNHECFLEGCTYEELEAEFQEYGQIKLFEDIA